MSNRLLPSTSGDNLPVGLPSQEVGYPIEAVTSPQQSFDIATLIRILVRWRWLVLAIIVATTVLSAGITALKTPLYRATATLELNPAPAKVVADQDSEDARQSDRDYLALQIGLIKSRSVAERVARDLGLGKDEAFLQTPADPNGAPSAAVGSLMANFAASGTSSDRIMQISYVHPVPHVAARVVNGFAEQAIENTFDRTNQATTRSRAYLQRRLEVTRRELERSERELIQYARAANIVNVVSGEGPTSKDSAGGTLLASNLVALNAQLADAQNARIVAQQRYAQSTASAGSAAAADSTIQSLRQQRAGLQAEYDQALNQFHPGYPDVVNLRSRLNGLDRQIAEASTRTTSTVSQALQADYVAAQNRERQLEARISQLQSQLLDLNDRGVRYTILQRAVDANRSIYNALLARLGQENSSATRTASVELIDTAQVPGAPFSPNLPRAIVLGLLGGAVLGAGAAMGAERWYDTINLPDDLKEALGLPILGAIPKAPASEQIDELIADPKSPLSEAYHSARANLQYLRSTGAPRSILFTSSKAGEGKTSSTIAIAADFISVGRRVVVVDADLRNPSLRGNSDKRGLSDLLSGAASLEEVLDRTETPELFLIHAGATPPNPAALLESPALAQVISELESMFDLVLVDGPPVLGLADAPLLSRVVDATVLIVEAGKTRRGAARNALARLWQARGTVSGAILTKLDGKVSGYGYGYGYGADAYNYGRDGQTRNRRLIGARTDYSA